MDAPTTHDEPACKIDYFTFIDCDKKLSML